MKINSIQVLRGANYWSSQFPKLIQLRIEIEQTELIDDIVIKTIQHRFNLPVNNALSLDGQLAGIIGELALKLQQSAGASVGFLVCKETKFPDTYNIIFEYETEKAGKETAKAAVKIIQFMLDKKEVEIESVIESIITTYLSEKPTSILQQILTTAKLIGIPIIPLSDEGKLQLGYGKNGVDIEKDSSAESVIQLFQSSNKGRIPIIAVTGSNGKTTTTRLIAHIIKCNHQKVGFTTSDGIYIDGKMIDEGDTTGPISAEIVLRNKEVEVAVLETARGGIVRAGLCFDVCDIAVVTNVQDDHLGISDIETMEDLAKVKSVIVQAVKTDGYAVLNADNAYTVAMGKNAPSKVAWFGMDIKNPIIQDALKNGNTIAFIENDELFIQLKEDKIKVAHLKNVPITFDGKLGFMIQNALAAALATSLFGIDTEIIAQGLNSFFPSAEQTPGRMNIFEFNNCRVMVDFAHNPDGFAGIRDFMATIDSPYKIGIIVGTGDRKEEDVRELGRLSAAMFDHILIHQVKFLRGKTAEKLVELLVEGILSFNPKATWQRIPDEVEPLGFALSIAPQNSFITALSDVLNNPTQLIATYKGKMAEGE
jgi:UDP-N-acetylmuramyl tripeptide synthase